jgi:hypothetical protein
MGGLPPTGSLGPGKSVTMETGLIPVKGQRVVKAVVLWRYGTKTYAQAGAPSHRKKWSRRRWAFWAPKSNEKMVQRFFADAGPFASWQLVSSRVVD